MKISIPKVEDIPRFDRQFFESENILSRIGGGAIGGKGSGLALASSIVKKALSGSTDDRIRVSIPRFVVIATDVFDAFMQRNKLYDLMDENMPDDRIALAFQRAAFPAEFAGDLRALISAVNSPLAIRSSSMLEDAVYEPFAGVYETKMIPNNQPDTDTRYRKLVEAVKFVYASTFFNQARGYASMTGHSQNDEKMAVLVQEVVGLRHGDRFYPDLSGVARSYNFYPVGRARPEEGVIDLALGLGKTIVDGANVWTYSPAHPNINPPFTTNDLLKNSQTTFWSVNMGKPPTYDPIKETEFLMLSEMQDAESDGVLSRLASTYVAANDRVVMGTGPDGPRILNFAPLLQLDEIPFNDTMKQLLEACEETFETPVEIEMAATIDRAAGKLSCRFGFLQVRPMVVSTEQVNIGPAELSGENVLIASNNTLGNGILENLGDVIYVKNSTFAKEHTRDIAQQINDLNRGAQNQNQRYVLIGFGRWGSSDPWLGIPVDWGNISAARVIVEATLPEMNVELSQGSHFFHNITSLQIPYLSVSFDGPYIIDWDWLDSQPAVAETEYVRHIKCSRSLTVKVDGRNRLGVIVR